MHISAYEFGRITIDGSSYTSDVVVFPDGVKDGWWRREGHRLHVDDLAAIIAAAPEVLVLGTGYYGRVEVPPATRDYLVGEGIELVAEPSTSAVATFNALQARYARIVGAFHLTC